MRAFLVLVLLVFCTQLQAGEIQGSAIQGNLIFGLAAPGSSVSLDGKTIAISADGHFVIGFGRDETGTRELQVTSPGGEVFQKNMPVQAQEYAIERVDGLPPATVTPDPSALARIKEDGRMVANARLHRDKQAYYANGFTGFQPGRNIFC